MININHQKVSIESYSEKVELNNKLNLIKKKNLFKRTRICFKYNIMNETLEQSSE